MSTAGDPGRRPDDREPVRETRYREEPVDEERGRPWSAEDRQRAEYGGFNFGAAFFGWLVAIALTVLLTALASAILAAVGAAAVGGLQDAETVGIVSAIVLLVLLFVAYFGGGYVAGRMSRFDGGRQGLAVWLIGLIVTVLLVLAGYVLGQEFNLLQQVNVPTIPVGTDALTTAGVITLVLVVLVTLAGAVLGGKTGERYHRKVDRAGAV